MNRNSLAHIDINNFDGLDRIKTSVYATDKTLNAIANGKNFTINDGILEVSKSPRENGIVIPDEDKDENENICNGFGKFFIAGFYYYIYVINGWIYKAIGTNLTKIYDTQLDKTAICNFTVYADKLIIQNGIEVIEFDGTDCEAQTLNDPQDIVGTDNKFQGSQIANNNLYYYTIKAIYKPNPNTTNDFDNTLGTVDALIPQTPQGGNILGLRQLSGKLSVIFMANKQTLKLTGSEPMGAGATNPHQISLVSDSVGAISQNSHCDTGTEIFFASTRGIEKLSTIAAYGDIEFVNIFNKIKDVIEPYVTDKVNAKYCFMAFLHDKIHTMFRTVSGNSVLFSYDIVHETIEYSEFAEAFSYMSVIDDILVFGDTDGKIYDMASRYYNHDEMFVEFNYYPTRYGLGTVKKWNKLLVYVETDTGIDKIKLSVKHFKQDYISTAEREENKKIEPTAVWNDFLWGEAKWGSEGVKLVRFKNLGKSKAIKFRIDTTNPEQHIRIKKIELYYTPLGIEKG